MNKKTILEIDTAGTGNTNRRSSKSKTVVVAMSGGVDSSVAAYLLHKQGFDVIGISMRLWSYAPENTHGCCTPDDLYDARRVADQLGIPYYVFNFEQKFKDTVVKDFVEQYRNGETPNPCVRCNTDIKFDILLQRTKELGADFLATGHYARLVEDQEGTFYLKQAVDLAKDQSYFLFGMNQTQLSKLVFPLGNMTKPEVRAVAKKAGILTSEKKESQEICFVPTNYKKFVSDRIDAQDIKKGKLVDQKGNVLGEHEGIHGFTIGQRKGINIPTTLPMFVSHIDKNSGDITIGDQQSLMKQTFVVREMRYTKDSLKEGDILNLKIRSHFKPAQARVLKVDDKVTLSFDEPQKSITPGQAAVLYKDQCVIAGGWIDQVLK